MRMGTGVRQWSIRVFSRLPGPTTLRMVILAMLVVVSPLLMRPGPDPADPAPEPTMTTADLAVRAVPTVRPYQPAINTSRIGIGVGSDRGPVAVQSVQTSSVIAPTAVAQSPVEGSLLPEHRILMLYGLPGDPSFGMVGQYDNLRLLEILREKAAEFEERDPGRPILLGLQIIVSAAQTTPGVNGSYVRDTSASTIYSYIEFTRANGMVLFLDAQVGRRTVPEDVQRLERYLIYEHVHLAVDPQFNVDPTEIPRQDAGSMTAAEILWVQEYLVDIATANSLPPKILIVHQFIDEMIVNRPLLHPVRGVQLVINVGLWGDVEHKAAAYQALVADDPIEFGGIMISSGWDNPAMQVGDILNLPAAPDIVLYQ